jgi:selenide,water dikinase
MAHLSGVNIVFSYGALPWLPGAQHYAAVENAFPGGASNNLAYFGQWVTFEEPLDEAARLLLFDPETSGGLLIAVMASRAPALLNELAARGLQGWSIGHVVPGSGHIRVEK